MASAEFKTDCRQRFNLYMPDGKQLSYHKGMNNDFVVFSLKKNCSNEKTLSHVRLPFNNKHNESEKLMKTRNDKVLMFRINLKDDKYGQFKKGQVEKLINKGNGNFEESQLFSQSEIKEINRILKDYLPSFF